MRFDLQFIKSALSDVSNVSGTFPPDVRLNVDSRAVQPGDIFVALQGAHVDGHDFIAEAAEKGAIGFIISKFKTQVLDALVPKKRDALLIIEVVDTFDALVCLATAWRAQFSYPVVAITGSVGKTSTKETIANILDVNGNSYLASHGNQNTRIGVALNIFRMRDFHEMAIFEVGVSRRGEMAQIVHMLRPTTGVVTNIGHSHMEGLGSLNDIALEKRDVFKYFTEDSIGIVNGDQPLLANVSYPHPVIKFGSKTTNQIQARKVRIAGSHISFILKIYKEKHTIILKQPHASAVFNVMAATVACHFLGVNTDVIVQAIQMPLVIAGRFEQCRIKGNKGTIINDCYNANPESMKAALMAFQQIETKAYKVAVLGDMLELGVNSPFWHRQLGRFLRKIPSLKKVILVGNLVEWIQEAAPVGLEVQRVATWQEAVRTLRTTIEQESVVLVKGSRAMALGNIVKEFAE